MNKNKIPKVIISAGMIQGGYSGVGRYVVELADRIGQMTSIELYVAGLDADRRLFPQINDDRWCSIPSSCSSGIKNLLWHQWRLPKILKQGGYDLLHIPSYRRIVAFCPVAQLATIHDCAPFRLKNKYGFLRGIFGRNIVPFLAKRCQHILTVSEFTKKDLIQFFKLQESSIKVIYNGLNHKLYYPHSSEEINAFRSLKGLEKPFILYISRLEHPGKNHIRLIEAYELFRDQTKADVDLILGGAPWSGSEVIMERAAKSSYSKDIKLPGFIEDLDLPLWYASASAMVFPSLFEGFGLPVIEALASQVCVTSSDRGSLPEVGGDAVLYFDPEDTKEIAKSMVRLYGEDQLQHTERLQLGTRQASRFDWDKAALATCQCYLSLTQ